MNHRETRRALPDELPEWRQVDTHAKFWSVRHYDPADAVRDPSSPLAGKQRAANWPDAQAVGIVFEFDPGRFARAQVRYLSQNENALKLFYDEMTSASAPGQDFKPKIHQKEPGVIEMQVLLEDRDQTAMFLFVLWTLFGHAIYV